MKFPRTVYNFTIFMFLYYLITFTCIVLVIRLDLSLSHYLSLPHFCHFCLLSCLLGSLLMLLRVFTGC
jgi:hypothetical protein